MRAERAEWFARLSVQTKTPVQLLKAMTQRELGALIDALEEDARRR